MKTDKGAWVVNAGVERSENLKVDGANDIADAQDTTVSELEEIYEKLDDELKIKNFKAMSSNWTPNFTETQGGKVSQRVQVEKGLAALFAKISDVSNASHKINDIKTADNTFLVEVARSLEGTMLLSGKKVPFDYSYQANDYWSKNEQGAWKLSSSEILGERFIVDGKEVQ